jgi:hypothetical protein
LNRLFLHIHYLVHLGPSLITALAQVH